MTQPPPDDDDTPRLPAEIEQLLRGLTGGEIDPQMASMMQGMGLDKVDPQMLAMVMGQVQAMFAAPEGDTAVNAVLATDIDEVSAQIAGENAQANGAGAFVESIHATSFDHAAFAERGPFDLIVANILAGPLVELAPGVKTHLASGGAVILSGLMNEEEDRVVAAYAAQGLKVVDAKRLEGWSTLTLAE